MGGGRRRWHSEIKHPKLHDRDWLHERYVVRGIGLTAIAKEAGAKSTATVLHALGLAGIPIAGHSGPQRRWEPTKQELIAEYVEAGSVNELARRRGLSDATIRNVFRRHALRPSDVKKPDAEARYALLADREQLAGALYENTVSEVAGELSCSEETVRRAARQKGVTWSSRTPQQTKDRAVRLYLAGFSLTTVAQALQRDPANVYRWLLDADVDTTQRRRQRRG